MIFCVCVCAESGRREIKKGRGRGEEEEEFFWWWCHSGDLI